MSDNLVARDARYVWHPYSQHGNEPEPIAVTSATGSILLLADGREIIDAVSSWWTCLHGHGHPALVNAIFEQAKQLDHVIFAGVTHESAVALAEALVKATPSGLDRVFFSDNGSTAVEVGLKMVHQAWGQRGEPERSTFVALDGGYHGDTFGAMAVGDPDPFFQAYKRLLFPVRRTPANLEAMSTLLNEIGAQCAGVIIEPLVQGAAGMKMHTPDFVRGVHQLCQEHGIPMIADEVMTGFGRTGSLFACEQAGISPDIMCLSKGLTGGTMPLSVTLTTNAMFETFRSDDRSQMFFHGHSFTANPIGCAVARASLQLSLETEVHQRLADIGAAVEKAFLAADPDPERYSDLRRMGGIFALDLKDASGKGYLTDIAPRLRRAALDRGVLLRPLGHVLYALPPASTTPEQCETIGAVMAELVSGKHL